MLRINRKLLQRDQALGTYKSLYNSLPKTLSSIPTNHVLYKPRSNANYMENKFQNALSCC